MLNIIHRNIIRSIFILLPLSILIGCGSSKQLIQSGDSSKLPRIKDKVLFQRMDSLSNQQLDFFYTKIKTKYKDTNQSIRFKTTVKMRKDSAINALITFVHIPVYNCMITTDSVTLLDKRHHCYIQEGIDFFKSRFNVDFTYQNIEEIFLGLPLGWKDLDYHYRIKNPYKYILVAMDDRKKRKKRFDKGENMSIRYYLDSTGKQLNRLVINRPRNNVHIDLKYKRWHKVDSMRLPNKVHIVITTDENVIKVDLEYRRTMINQKRTLYLMIPKKYEECNQ